MPLTPGSRLGSYTIESLIGSGGMGEVYKARDERLNRTVAIKRMFADDMGRFQSEARAIAAINHPHICPVVSMTCSVWCLYSRSRGCKVIVPLASRRLRVTAR
jgi:serine/threonine protein kinase